MKEGGPEKGSHLPKATQLGSEPRQWASGSVLSTTLKLRSVWQTTGGMVFSGKGMVCTKRATLAPVKEQREGQCGTENKGKQGMG